MWRTIRGRFRSWRITGRRESARRGSGRRAEKRSGLPPSQPLCRTPFNTDFPNRKIRAVPTGHRYCDGLSGGMRCAFPPYAPTPLVQYRHGEERSDVAIQAGRATPPALDRHAAKRRLAMTGVVTPEQFIAKWRANTRMERAAGRVSLVGSHGPLLLNGHGRVRACVCSGCVRASRPPNAIMYTDSLCECERCTRFRRVASPDVHT